MQLQKLYVFGPYHTIILADTRCRNLSRCLVLQSDSRQCKRSMGVSECASRLGAALYVRMWCGGERTNEGLLFMQACVPGSVSHGSESKRQFALRDIHPRRDGFSYRKLYCRSSQNSTDGRAQHRRSRASRQCELPQPQTIEVLKHQSIHRFIRFIMGLSHQFKY